MSPVFIGGMRVVSDASVPEGTWRIQHADGRVEDIDWPTLLKRCRPDDELKPTDAYLAELHHKP